MDLTLTVSDEVADRVLDLAEKAARDPHNHDRSTDKKLVRAFKLEVETAKRPEAEVYPHATVNGGKGMKVEPEGSVVLQLENAAGKPSPMGNGQRGVLDRDGRLETPIKFTDIHPDVVWVAVYTPDGRWLCREKFVGGSDTATIYGVQGVRAVHV